MGEDQDSFATGRLENKSEKEGHLSFLNFKDHKWVLFVTLQSIGYCSWLVII